MSTESCPFCQIVRGEASATIIHRDETVVAFRDIQPVAPTHVLIVPTKHLNSVHELQDGDGGLLGKMLALACDLAGREGLEAGGYRLVINTGADAGQSVYHLHMHLLGGRRMHWPPG